MFPLFSRHAPCSNLGLDFPHTCPPCLGNEPAALHLSFRLPLCVGHDRWLETSRGLLPRALDKGSRWSINQFTPRASDQPINQSLSQQMLLLSLSKRAGSGVLEVVSPTKAEGLKVSAGRKKSDFSCFDQNFNLFRAHYSHLFSLEDNFFLSFSHKVPYFSMMCDVSLMCLWLPLTKLLFCLR